MKSTQSVSQFLVWWNYVYYIHVYIYC